MEFLLSRDYAALKGNSVFLMGTNNKEKTREL